jgi:RNA polymerase sigma factor (sigma-70 family)
MNEGSETHAVTVDEAYAAHRVELLRLALLLVGSEAQAEDIVQAVFTAAHGRWDSIDHHLPYLKRAIVNRAGDTYRRRERERRWLARQQEPVTEIPEIDETWHVLCRLPRTQRTVVVLHFYEDLPLVAIAEILGCPAGTVRSQLHRALDRLRRTLP